MIRLYFNRPCNRFETFNIKDLVAEQLRITKVQPSWFSWHYTDCIVELLGHRKIEKLQDCRNGRGDPWQIQEFCQMWYQFLDFLPLIFVNVAIIFVQWKRGVKFDFSYWTWKPARRSAARNVKPFKNRWKTNILILTWYMDIFNFFIVGIILVLSLCISEKSRCNTRCSWKKRNWQGCKRALSTWSSSNLL